jgi:hypothetical protein
MHYRLLAMTVTLSIVHPFTASYLGVPVWAQGGRAAPPGDGGRGRAVNQLAIEQSLHGAALANGGTFAFDFDMHTAWRARPQSLQALIDSTPLIVVGTIQASEARVTPNGRMIDTIYSVTVSDTLKGDARSAVSVRVPGGRVTFPDGAIAEVRTPGFALGTGGTYALFLRPAPVGVGTDPADAAQGVQVLSVGPPGVVDLSTGHVQSLALAQPENAIPAQLNGRDAARFLQDVRAQARYVR